MPDLLKRIFLILALAGILSQTFSKGIILLNFEMNRDFIAKNLCIKKDEANNCCKGSCHLKKQLSEDEQKEASSPFQNQRDNSEIPFFYEEGQSFVSPGITGTQDYVIYIAELPFSPEKSIFHPPPVG